MKLSNAIYGLLILFLTACLVPGEKATPALSDETLYIDSNFVIIQSSIIDTVDGIKAEVSASKIKLGLSQTKTYYSNVQLRYVSYTYKDL